MQLVVSYRVKPVSASLVRQPRGQPVTQGASAQCIQDTEWKLRSPCLFSRVKVWRNGCWPLATSTSFWSMQARAQAPQAEHLAESKNRYFFMGLSPPF